MWRHKKLKINFKSADWTIEAQCEMKFEREICILKCVLIV